MKPFFVVGNTDFGIDQTSLRVELSLRPDGFADLLVEVAGDETTFDGLAESKEWSWALYPPFFFIRQYPVAPHSSTLPLVCEIPGRNESFEMNLYMMEYCEVSSVVLNKSVDGISITGRVDLWGKDLPFHIQLPGVACEV